MQYKQLSVTCDGKPLGEYTGPVTNPCQAFLTAVRMFALTETDLRVEVWERLHDHAERFPKPCLTCPPGNLIRVWNAAQPPIMRSAAFEALLALDPEFAKLDMPAASARITDVLVDFY